VIYPHFMAIDDNPIEALRRQFELEDSSKSPVSTGLVKAASELLGFGKLPGPLDPIIRKVAEIISDDGHARIKIMLETVADQVIKHDKEIRELREKQNSEQGKQRSEQEARLVVDGARRAAATRSMERVKRIGIILAQAIFEPTPPDEDEIEEMMRVAAELAEEDVKYLGDLVRVEGRILRGKTHIERYTAYIEWERGPWGTRVDPRIDSVFHKLESYGLVSAIAPNNTLNVSADIQTRYVLLPKGLRFADLIGQ